jgi:RNA polymerase sigma-70 factor (ECF subfamily)
MKQKPFTTNSNEELMQYVKAGKLDALTTLVERFRRDMVTQAYHVIHCQHTAQDLVQDCFEQIWKRRAQLPDTVSDVRAYLFTAVRKRAKTKQAKLIRERNAEEQFRRQRPCSYFFDPAIRRELMHGINNSFLSLADQQRIIAIYRILDRESYKYIAGALDITEHTVRSTLTEAKKKIMEKLKHLK